MEKNPRNNEWIGISFELLGRMAVYTLMCLIVSVTLMSLISGKAGNLVAQTVDLVLILSMPYLTAWKLGDADCNRVNYGRVRRDGWLGFKMGLIACSPWILCAALLLLARTGLFPEAILPIYRMVDAPFMPLCHALMPTTLTLAEQSWGGVIGSALSALLPVAVLGVGYRFGLDRVSFVDDVVYHGRPHKSK